MTWLDVSLPFALGLASSLHCAQMCGPLVLTYSLSAGVRTPGPHLAYNLGRILTYSLLGAAAGSLGSAVTALSGAAQTAAIIAGALLIVAGLLTAGWFPSQNLIQITAAPSLISRTAGRLVSSRSAASKLGLGLTLGFLPCGLVYAALLKALAAGDAATGAVTMAAFGTGTAASLLPIGLFSSFFAARLGRWSNRIAAVAMLLMGCFLLWRGLHPVTFAPGCHHS